MFFHLTDADESFNIFANEDEGSLGFHFGTLHAAEHRRRMIYRMGDEAESGGMVMPVLARARNPVVVPDCHMWDLDVLADALSDAGALAPEVAEWVVDSCDLGALWAALEEVGHDAILYRNECEGAFDRGPQGPRFQPGDDNWSLILWRPEQTKSAWADSFDPRDPRLSPQSPTARRDWTWWRERTREISSWKLDLQAGAAELYESVEAQP